MVQIAPSMLAADFLHLENDVELVNKHADIFHLDIMDGTFVPNISYGFPIVEAIAKIAAKENLENGYRVVNNCGKDGGQTVGHIHFHLLARRNLQWPPG